MRLLILGAEGLLGTAVSAVAGADPRVEVVAAAGRHEVDVTSPDDVSRIIRSTRPDVVINTAALMPADLCDETPVEAYAVNTLAPRFISRACRRSGAVAVYVSTDFVFDGRASSPYHPDSRPDPILTYGVSKLAGEYETRLGSDRSLVVRTACLFGPPPRSSNARPCFVDRVLEKALAGAPLVVVDNIVTSPTYTCDLAAMLLALLLSGVDRGTYHMVNQGSASWYELCCAAVSGAGIRARVEPTQEQFLTSSPRPLHTPLIGNLPKEVWRISRPWRAALDDYLEAFGWRESPIAHSAGAGSAAR